MNLMEEKRMIQVLIADDEKIIREGLKHQLEESGIEIESIFLASNGLEALELIEKHRPEILLLDINMPVKNGLEIIEDAMKINPLAKIILISGYDEFQYAQKAISLGVSDYLLKPVNIATLKNTVSKAVGQYQNRLWEVSQLNRNKEEQETSLEELIPYIKAHFTDSSISLSTLAEHFHVSDAYLSRLIRKQCGNSFSDLLLQLRMELAKSLLEDHHTHMIYEVATLVGYSSQHYFCRMFKEYTGVSPTDYRMMKLNATSGSEIGNK